MIKQQTPIDLPFKSLSDIPNIDIGKSYDQNYVDADIQYELLENLANFFGRNMPVHYHDRFYQIHVVLNGVVHVHLDETSYSAEGPMFFLTPPTVPHAFIIENEARGHVITARQEMIWGLPGTQDRSAWHGGFMNTPLCVELSPDTDKSAARMLSLLSMMADENDHACKQNCQALKALLQLVMIDISRLAEKGQQQQNTRKEDVRIFHLFNELIEKYYREHITLKCYAEKISVTEARLNEICRRLAGLPSKRLIIERLMQEARRLLMFTSGSINEISYELGFKDPAYFARFFRRNCGETAGQYRASKKWTANNQ